MSSRLTAKERNLIKGALRRVFARSELHQVAIKNTVVPFDSVPIEIRNKRKRVKTWCKCPLCGKYEAKSKMPVDHKEPLIAIGKTLTNYTWDAIIEERLWCEPSNLQAICIDCHKLKSKTEAKERRTYGKRR